jgi:hypothetical protein
VIYLTRPQDTYQPDIGDFMGMMTNELDAYGEGAYIEEFASAGPKNYGYKVRVPGNSEPKCCVKIRGFTLNYANSLLLNFEVLKEKVRAFIQQEDGDTVTLVNTRIVTTKFGDVQTRSLAKRYRVVYDKRVVFADYSTLPFGY